MSSHSPQARPTPARLRNPFRQPVTRTPILPSSATSAAAGHHLIRQARPLTSGADAPPRPVKAAKTAARDKGREVVVVRSAESSPGSSPENSPSTRPSYAWSPHTQASQRPAAPVAPGGSAPRRRKPPPTSTADSIALGKPFSWIAGPSQHAPSSTSPADDAPGRPSPVGTSGPASFRHQTSRSASAHSAAMLASGLDGDGGFSSTDEDDESNTRSTVAIVCLKAQRRAASLSHSMSSPPALPTLLEEPDEEETAALPPPRSATI